jgi:hypothetical protein
MVMVMVIVIMVIVSLPRGWIQGIKRMYPALLMYGLKYGLSTK